MHIPELAAEAESPWAEGAFTELPLYAGRTKPEVPTMSLESEQPDDTGGYQKITMQDAKIERQLIVLPSCDTFQPWQ